MSVLGIDFGSHTASFALWNEENNLLEVLADDLGIRAIPCIVAYRGDETIVGQSALGQQHKNTPNTFDDVRSLLFNHEVTTVNVPLLEKEVTTEEINTVFFRNIHNQVKQQAGKAVREAVVSVPFPLDEMTAQRYIASAQAGGIRIKSFLPETTAALLAYGLDESTTSSITLVVDLGWSRCTMAIYNISAGLFTEMASLSTADISGSLFVKALSEFCAKDFTKKYKIPVQENKKSMIRLKRECEVAAKSLSTGTEATIDLDSLCEGVDYSYKVSRARYEDLLAIPFIQFKNLLQNVLTAAKVNANAIHQVCLAGGPSSTPKFVSVLKQLLPNAVFPKVRFETSEAASIGAAIQAKLLYQLVR
jgi:molecular chaperone DnaK (HSP70)